MQLNTKKYLKKRSKIIKIIEDIEIEHEDFSENLIIYCNPDFWSARDAADKILSKMGINKTQEIKKQETQGFALAK